MNSHNDEEKNVKKNLKGCLFPLSLFCHFFCFSRTKEKVKKKNIIGKSFFLRKFLINRKSISGVCILSEKIMDIFFFYRIVQNIHRVCFRCEKIF